MMTRSHVIPLAAIGLLWSGPALASDQDDLQRRIADLEARDSANRALIDELRGELHDVKRSADEEWLDDQRADEIRSLVTDVLADADTRASLLQSGASAGWDNGFYIGSADGAFRLNIKGLIQTRYMGTFRDDDTGSIDTGLAGFQIMRSNLFLTGHIADPKIKYAMTLAGARTDGGVGIETAMISYDYDENWTVFAGRFRNFAFTREERVGYAQQLTVERSYLNETFTVDYVEGMGLNYNGDGWRWQGVWSDGSNTGLSGARDYTAEDSDFAFTTRVDFLLAGTWGQTNDFTALGNTEASSMIGGGVHYEIGETGTASPNDDFLQWTLDYSYESDNGFSIYAAAVGLHSDNESGDDVDQMGFLVQAGFLLTDSFEPFVRYEYIDWDDFLDAGATTASTDDELSIVTGGFNYYLRGHAAKLSVDVQYAIDNVPTSRSNVGLLQDAAGEDGQISLRAQFQLMF